MNRKIIFLIVFSLFSLFVIAQQRSNYRDAKFDSIADFSDAKFDSTADFWGAKFGSAASFEGAKFGSTADFRGAEFGSTAYFWGAKFGSTADFEGAKFDSNAYFVGAKFDSIADFGHAEFDSIANFTGAKFGSTAYFNGLPLLLNFTSVNDIKEEIDLTYTIINPKFGKCYICLENSNIDKIKFRYSRFNLYFPDYTDVEIKSNVYEKLLAKQKKEGFITSIVKLEKEYKSFRFLESGEYSTTGGIFLNFLNKYWWGYGYNKGRIIENTIYLFLFFSFINTLCFRRLSLRIYEIPKLKEIRNKIKNKNKIVLFIKVFPIASFYTGFIFFGLYFNIDKLNYSENLKGWKIFNLVWFFTVYVVGIVCIGYLANYVLSS